MLSVVAVCEQSPSPDELTPRNCSNKKGSVQGFLDRSTRRFVIFFVSSSSGNEERNDAHTHAGVTGTTLSCWCRAGSSLATHHVASLPARHKLSELLA